MAKVAADEREEKVDELRTKISGNQGEVILSVRELRIKEGGGRGTVASPPEDFYYVEAGIINGELEDFVPDAIQAWRFNIQTSLDSFSFGSKYYFNPDLAIPVRKKLTNNSSWIFHLNFFPKALKQAKEGKIVFGSDELFPSQEIVGYRRELPALTSLDILAGEEEIREFAEKMEVLREKTDDFLGLFKQGEIERIIQEYDYKNRERISGELVRKVASLCTLTERLEKIKQEVMKATVSFVTDDEGRGCYEKWHPEEEVEEYRKLRSKIKKEIGFIEGVLVEGDEAGLVNHLHVDGAYAGVPAKVKPVAYIVYVNKEVLLPVQETLEEINAHLEEARKKAQ